MCAVPDLSRHVRGKSLTIGVRAMVRSPPALRNAIDNIALVLICDTAQARG